MHSRDPEWQDLESDLDRLLALDTMARAAALDEFASDNPARANALRQWLHDIAQSEGLLERLPSRPHALASGAPWRLLRPIGSGGMGEVWLGERADGAFQRQVAIKFLRADRATLGDRLIRERELLARLHHPGIAMLLDGGVSADGSPYLVTEWIDGVRLDHWLRDTRPDLRSRVDVLRRITEAVGYAHANLVVHRDLKPANVMIDRDGIPHLLDFGIARLLDDPHAGSLTDDRALTPAFAAPEQLTGAPITTRSDIYALGGLLYWLLTGRTPHNSEGLALAELVKRVCDDSIQPPSANGAGSTLGLDADLDAIVLTALAREPERRYASAELLELDLQCWLDGRSVSARLPTRVERLRRFVLAHRAESVLFCSLIFALCAGLVGTTWQAHVAQTERDTAQAERDAAAIEARRNLATRDFLLAMFSDRDEQAERIAPIELLRRSIGLIDSIPVDAEGGRATLRVAVGELFMQQRDLPNAQRLFESALSGTDGVLSAPTRAAALCQLGFTRSMLGNAQAAAPLIDAGIQIARAAAESAHETLAYCLTQKGMLLYNAGALDDAITILRTAVAAASDDPNPRTLNMLGGAHAALGNAFVFANRTTEAIIHYQAAFDILQKLGRGQSGDAAVALGNWAMAEWRDGRVADAEKRFQSSIALRRKAAGGTTGLAQALLNYASLQLARSELDKASQLIEEAEQIFRSSGVTSGIGPTQAQLFRAEIAVHRGQQSSAEAALLAAENLAKSLPNSNVYLARVETVRGLLLMPGDRERAAVALQNAIALARAAGKSGEGWLLRPLVLDARLQVARGDLAAAAACLSEADTLADSMLAATHWSRGPLALAHAELLERQHRRSAARALALNGRTLLANAFGTAHPEVISADRWLVDHLN